MTDRLLNHAWWLATMLMIVVTGGGAMLLAYFGVFDLFAMRYTLGAAYLLTSIPLGTGCYLLCRYRNDLV